MFGFVLGIDLVYRINYRYNILHRHRFVRPQDNGCLCISPYLTVYLLFELRRIYRFVFEKKVT